MKSLCMLKGKELGLLTSQIIVKMLAAYLVSWSPRSMMILPIKLILMSTASMLLDALQTSHWWCGTGS